MPFQPPDWLERLRCIRILAWSDLRTRLLQAELWLWGGVLPLALIALLGTATATLDGSAAWSGAEAERLEGAIGHVVAERAEQVPTLPAPTWEVFEGVRVPRFGQAQVAPGLVLALALLQACTAGALVLLRERRRGLVARLLVTRCGAGTLAAGKSLGLALVVALQLGLTLVGSHVLFGSGWGAHPSALVVLLGAFAAFAAALGICVASLARTEAQVLLLGAGGANALAVAGGLWFPPEAAPPWVRGAMDWGPTGGTRALLEDVLHLSASPVRVLPLGAVLLGLALALVWCSARCLARQRPVA